MKDMGRNKAAWEDGTLSECLKEEGSKVLTYLRILVSKCLFMGKVLNLNNSNIQKR